MKTFTKQYFNNLFSKRQSILNYGLNFKNLAKNNFSTKNNINEEEEFIEVSQYIHENAFNILNLDSKIRPTEIDIKKQYRKLVIQYHPDVNKSKEAVNKFIEIQS